jgi:hypothetical protein
MDLDFNKMSIGDEFDIKAVEKPKLEGSFKTVGFLKKQTADTNEDEKETQNAEKLKKLSGFGSDELKGKGASSVDPGLYKNKTSFGSDDIDGTGYENSPGNDKGNLIFYKKNNMNNIFSRDDNGEIRGCQG